MYVCVCVYDLWVQDVLMYVYTYVCMYVCVCVCVCFVGTGCMYIRMYYPGEPTIL